MANPTGKERSPAAPGNERSTPTEDHATPIIPPAAPPPNEITVDYAFSASGHYTGISQGHCQATTPPGGAIATLLADIEGSLKNEHGEASQLVWWTVRVAEAKEPA